MDMRVVKATKYRKIFVGSHKCGLDAILSKNGGIARWKCCWEFTENISGLLLDKKQGAPFGAPCQAVDKPGNVGKREGRACAGNPGRVPCAI